MALFPSRARISEMWRYAQAGVLNICFGYAAYAVLVAFGINIYIAQLAAHVMGASFNYLTYSKHVFRDSGPAKLRFVLAYVANYMFSASVLVVAERFVESPYISGMITVAFVAIVNYFVLKYLVFNARAA